MKEAQFGNIYRVSDTEAYVFSVIGRKLQVWNIFGHEDGISIETSQLITNVLFRKGSFDQTEVIVCSLV